jgi:pantoate kinase
MILQIPVSPETEAALRERANARGEDIAAYAARLLHDALNAPSVDELLAPFRRQVAESGMTDKELNDLCEELRQEVWMEQQTAKAKDA